MPATAVFPAYAGMFRSGQHESGAGSRFPRIRGDVPEFLGEFISGGAFSPHTRGCSLDSTREQLDQLVFPAYAGMFLEAVKNGIFANGFPRIRGDVPQQSLELSAQTSFSPHTRGCSSPFISRAVNVPVFPAYAGMFRKGQLQGAFPQRFPRIRGDVPLTINVKYVNGEFSPHTRGCSGATAHRPNRIQVFPAYAGMFRSPAP